MIHYHRIPEMEVNGHTAEGQVNIDTDNETVEIRHPHLHIDRLPFKTIDDIQQQIQADLDADGK